MVEKTFEAIGRPLPGRRNIIISSNAAYQQPDCQVFSNIDSALTACGDSEEIFVIGGPVLYQALISRADRLYLTEIARDFAGDTFFPEIDYRQWREVDSPGSGK